MREALILLKKFQGKLELVDITRDLCETAIKIVHSLEEGGGGGILKSSGDMGIP